MYPDHINMNERPQHVFMYARTDITLVSTIVWTVALCTALSLARVHACSLSVSLEHTDAKGIITIEARFGLERVNPHQQAARQLDTDCTFFRRRAQRITEQ